MTPYGYCHCGCGERTSLAKQSDKRVGHVKGKPVRYRPGHFGAIPVSPIERLFTKFVIADNGCWLWTASCGRGGYGRFNYEGRAQSAHRCAYELLVGPIPDGLEIDHLCRVRNCVNPDHMEPVTHRVNVLRGMGSSAKRARQTHCKNGHPFDEKNTYMRPDGRRACRACGHERHPDLGDPND